MKYIIQDSGLKNSFIIPVAEALNELKFEIKSIGYNLQTDEIIGLEEIDNTVPTFAYGSVKLIKEIKKANFIPGAFYDEESFLYTTWLKHTNDLINQELNIATLQEVKYKGLKEVSFIRPLNGEKSFNGAVVYPDQVEYWFTKAFDGNIDHEQKIIVMPRVKIDFEWRIFMVDGKPISGSQYMQDGLFDPSYFVPKEAYEFASKCWLPYKHCTVDVGIVDNQYKVVEYNCINCSGFYDTDIKEVFCAISTVFD